MRKKNCKSCDKTGKPLSEKNIQKHMEKLDKNWQYDTTYQTIYRQFQFENYYATMAFVNATAWISHTENHHPDLIVSYNSCQVCYTTHAISGLSENDFICAQMIDAISK